MHDVEAIMSRLRGARSLPELLEASFDAFETIRVLARGSEDTVPSLFAAFMTVADAASCSTSAWPVLLTVRSCLVIALRVRRPPRLAAGSIS